jgi:diguanylate cyclase (GGDEF)-like protein
VTEGDDGGARLWAQACRQSEGELGAPWPDSEATALYAQVVGAPTGADTAVLEAAARAYARATGSMPLLARRLAALRNVVSGVAVRQGLDPGRLGARLDRATMAATQAALTQLEDAALTDALTEAGNRRALEQAARAALATAARTGQPVSLVAIDLDGLKAINDTHGHSAGDQALAGLSAAVRAALRATDQVFRIGGDEFVVLLPLASRDMVADLVRRMQLANAPKFSWGAATAPDDGSRLETLLQVADARLYQGRRAAGYRRDRDVTGLAGPIIRSGIALRRPAHHWARAAAVAALSVCAVAVLAFVLGTSPGLPRPTDQTTPSVPSSTTTPSSGAIHAPGGASGPATTIAGSGGAGSTTSAPTGSGGNDGGTSGTEQGGATTPTTTPPSVTVPTIPKLPPPTIPGVTLPTTTTTVVAPLHLQLPRLTLPTL